MRTRTTSVFAQSVHVGLRNMTQTSKTYYEIARFAVTKQSPDEFIANFLWTNFVAKV